MRLQTVRDSHGHKVRCYKCGAWMPLDGCIADLDGPAFEAYYHVKCQPHDEASAQRGRKE